MKRHGSSAFSAGIMTVAMAVAGLFAAQQAQAQTYKFGPSGINPSHHVWLQITGTHVEVGGEFDGFYVGTINCGIPGAPGVTNKVHFGVNHPTINGTGDSRVVDGWVSSSQFYIEKTESTTWIGPWTLNLESGAPANDPPTVSISAPSGGATYAAPATTITTSSTTTTSAPQYAVGDTGPGGGKVFYVGGGIYLEVAPSDWSGVADPGRTWSAAANQGAAVDGADGTAIGTGYQNSVDIVNQSGNVAATCAAVLARQYTGGGLSDWFLPSKDELTKLAENRSSVGFDNDGCGFRN
jgi:hypothetical protein